MRKTAAGRRGRPRAARRRPRPGHSNVDAILDWLEDYAVFTTDLEGRVKTWNQSAQNVFGYQASEIIGKSAALLFTPEDRRRKAPEAEFGTAREKGLAPDERWHLRKNGERFWVHGIVLALSGPSGRIEGLLKIGRDMTRLQAADRDKDVAERRLRLVTNAVSALISYITPDRRYAFTNGAYRRWFGEDPLGKTVEETIGAKAFAAIKPHLDRAFSGEHVEFVAEIPYQTGARWIRVEYIPDRDAQGEVRGVVALAADVTRQKRSQRELEDARDALARQSERLELAVKARTSELQEAVAELEAFTYTVSHDLRAPLRAIEGLLQLHLRNIDEGPEARAKRIERVMRAARRMDTLIKDLLAYSSIGRVSLEPEPVDLDHIVREIADREEYAEASFRVASPLGVVRAQTSLLTQAVANLVDNAVKFVKPGDKPRIAIFTRRRDARIRLFVEDHGIGIPLSQLERVFKPFERLHPRDEYEGTGIGLAIVRRTVERFGGSTGVEPIPGDGTRFWIELPEAA